MEPLELDSLPVDEEPGVAAVETLVGLADAVEYVELPLAVEVALAVKEAEVVSLMPHTASMSNVNGMLLASHSEFCRTMESRHHSIRDCSVTKHTAEGYIPGKTGEAHFSAMQQKYFSRYFC